MAGRRTAAVGVAALAAGVVALLLATRTSERREEENAARSSAESPASPTLAPADAPAPSGEAGSPTAAPSTSDAPTAEPLAPGEFRVPVRLRYASGAPILGEIEIGLALKDGDDVYVDEVFPGPTFEIVAPRSGVYRVFQLDIAGERYAPRPGDVELRAGSRIGWTLEEPRPAVLEVVEAGTRTLVPTARAYRYVWAREEHFTSFETPIQVPSRATLEGTPIQADRRGRIALPALWGKSSWYVIAPGRAWASVQARHGEKPDVVELSPGGALHLEISRWSELVTATVDGQWGTKGRARRPSRLTTIDTDQGPVQVHLPDEDEAQEDAEAGGAVRLILRFPAPDPSGTLDIEGLPVGPCGVGVRRGSWFEDGEVYGSGSVEIRAETARLSIEADVAKARRGSSVSGTLRVPASWKLDRIGISLRGRDASTVGTDRSAWFDLPSEMLPRFEWLDVPAGRYELDAYPTQWRTWIDVPEGGRRLDLTLPEACRGEVQVMDAESGAAIPSAEVRWMYELPDSGGGSLQKAKLDPTGGFHVFLAPEGNVRLSASAPGYVGTFGFGPRDEDVIQRMRPGASNRVTLKLPRAGAIVVRIHVDGVPVGDASRDDDYEILLAWDSGDQSGSTSREPQQGQARFEGVVPGTWTAHAFLVAPRRSVAEKEVQVKAGETVEVVLDVGEKR